MIQWPSFGPYHRARLEACANYFEGHGLELVAMQTAKKTSVYAWDNISASGFTELTLFDDDRPYQEIPNRLLATAIWENLNSVSPSAIAVNGYNFRESSTILKWCKRNNRPAILMSDSKRNDAPRNAFKEFVKRRLIKKFSSYFCAGPAHRDYLIELGAPENKIVTGYDVVDNDFFRDPRNAAPKLNLPGLDSERPFFLTSARFVARKNIPLLIRSYLDYCTVIESRGLETLRLIILGDGEQRQEIETLIRDTSSKTITLAGFRTVHEIAAYYHAASAFIMPSLQDQWGLVVNEAMAAGLPVLVSQTAGCAASLAEDGGNGFVFDPFSQKAMTEKMIEFHSLDDESKFKFGKRSLELIANYTPETFARNIFLAYRKART